MTIRVRLLFALLGLLLWSGASVCSGSEPEYLVRTWRNEDGLPHSTINSIIQTRDGYLWIATYVGLVRFDGIRFVRYSSSNFPELDIGRIANLFEDRDGTLWIALESGRLLARRGERVRIVIAGGGTNQPIVSMGQQRSGLIWFATAGGALGTIKDKQVEFVGSVNIPARRYVAIAVTDGDQLWVASAKGPLLWQNGRLSDPALPLVDGLVESMVSARDGGIWLYCKRRIWKVNGSEVIASLDSPRNVTGAAGVIDGADGTLWLGSNEGSLFFKKPGGEWTEVSNSAFQGLNRTFFEDREGNIWRGGFGSGLSRIRPRLFHAHELPGNGLDRYARTICADAAGNVWGILNDQVISRLSAGTETPEALPAQNITQASKTLLVDRRNQVWVGTDGGLLYRLRNGSFVRELSLGNGIETVNALFEDSSSNLWLGCTGGGGVLNLPGGEPAGVRTIPGMPYPDVRAIAESADGAMWFGTHYGGAFRWQNGNWTRFTRRNGLPSDYVRCFLAQPNGSLWIGTIHGLARWREGTLASITSDQGLWNDSISHIAADAIGNIWISSFRGIFRVRQKDLDDCADAQTTRLECVGYDRSDGLLSVECPGGFQPAGTRTPDGQLWFPTSSGLVSVSPKEFRPNSVPPPVQLESVAVDAQDVPINVTSREMKIPPGKRRLDLRFTALSFAAPEKVLFRHKLTPLDGDWSLPDSQRTVTYNYIPPGRYRFDVTACNNDGIWNPAGPFLVLVVQPFFWQTWWFKSAIGILVAMALAAVVGFRERWKARIRVEHLEQEHAIERERSRIARDIHDDLGANLSRIALLGQRVEGASHDRAEVERWIHLIPAAASRTIQSLDEIVWAINPKHDSLESLANYLSRFVQEFLSLAGIRCLLDVPTVLPQVSLGAEVRHNVVMAAREVLQNIVAHARATEVRVTLSIDPERLTICITDNGTGFDVHQTPAEGNGVANIKKRMEDIGATVDIVTGRDAGTFITFTIPQSQLHGRIVCGRRPSI